MRMRSRGKKRSFVAAAIAALSLLAVLLPAGPAGADKPAPIYWKTFGEPVAIEPTRIEIDFGTGVAFATGLTEWEGWGTARASAEGVLHLNTCKPFCAAGHFKTHRGLVTLFKVRHCNGQRRYVDIKIKPEDAPKGSWGSNCEGAQIKAP